MYEVDSEVHLLDRLAVIYRYRAIAISVFVLTTMAMLIQSYTAVPMYEARTRILIEDGQPVEFGQPLMIIE